MVIFPWTSDYCVGIAQFDQEHMKLVELTNRLYASILDGKAAVMVPNVLDGLTTYMRDHFLHEEMTMQTVGYPYTDRHTAQHNLFVGRVEDFRRECEEKSGSLAMIDVARELSLFLKSWLSEHMCGEDRAFGQYLNSRGMH